MKLPLLSFFCFLLIVGCSSSKDEEDYLPGSYYLGSISEVKLSQAGKLKAKATWDSIRPTLIMDSTVHGYSYMGISSEDIIQPVSPFMTFDYDTITGPSALTFHLTLSKKISPPNTYMYFGNAIIPCFGRVTDLIVNNQYKDSVTVIVDKGLRQLINNGGIRFDTDRGPTQKLTPAQVSAIRKTRTAFEALSLLHNQHNRVIY